MHTSHTCTHMYVSILGFTYKRFLMASKPVEDVLESPPGYPVHWVCPYLPTISEINCAIGERGAGHALCVFLNRD